MTTLSTQAEALSRSLILPVIVAPMFLISSPALVIAAARAGLMGIYPTANSRTISDLAVHLEQIDAAVRADGKVGQWGISLFVHPSYDRFDAELDLIAPYKPRLVITALGGPKRALERVHAFGGLVFSDVITLLHARKAVDAGADGLVLVASGAGGHTGTYSAFAFVEEVRKFWDGPIVLGGAISNARAVRAALTLGADFAYMGTRFIATRESMVSDEYREMLIRATLEDIVTTRAITGVAANWMRESLERANFDITKLDVPGKIDFSDIAGDSKAWKNIWGAGHGSGSVVKIQTVREIVEELVTDYTRLKSLSGTLDLWPRSATGVAPGGI
jgi:nitronate monooxygenase